MLQRRAVVDHGIETVEALAIVRDGQLHVGIVENAFGHGVTLGDAERDEAFGGGDHVFVEFAGCHLGPLSGGGFALRDHGVLAGARDALGEQ